MIVKPVKRKKRSLKQPKRLDNGNILLPDGEEVKVRKRYGDKRKDEKYISKRTNEINGIKPKRKGKQSIDKGSQYLIPIRIDHKTKVFVKEYLCFKPKWIKLIGSVEGMKEYISKIKSNEIKQWQI